MAVEPQGNGQSQAENQPQQPDLMGYPSVEALVNAKRSSDAEAKKLHDRNQQLEAWFAQQAQQPEVNPRQDVPQRSAAFDRLAEVGVPVDALQEAMRSVAGELFQPVVQQLHGHARARNHMLASYGEDYAKFEQDVARTLESDPVLQQRYNAIYEKDPVAATEYAYFKFADSKRREASRAPQPPADTRQTTDASIPSHGGGQNGQRIDDPLAEDIRRAYEAFNKSPSRQNAEAYAKLRLRQAVPNEVIGLPSR